MPPRTRKTAAVKPEPPVEETTPVSEDVTIETDDATDETEPKKRGRKVDPLTAVLREHQRAKAKFETAEKRHAKVAGVVEKYENAKAEYEAAKAALSEALTASGLSA